VYEDILDLYKARCPSWRALVGELSLPSDSAADQWVPDAVSRSHPTPRDFVQYSAEILFPLQLMAHPRRVTQPEQAALFVVPAFFGLSSRGGCGNDTDNTLRTRHVLKQRGWLRRKRGRDHMLVSTDYVSAATVRRLRDLAPDICLGTQLSFRSAGALFRTDVRNSFAVPLVALPMPSTLPQWSERNTTLFFGGAQPACDCV
jgi:hypothetical protein